MDYSLSAIVLSSEPSGESDEIFTFYSPILGRFQAKVKSSKKTASKLKMPLQDFSVVKITFAPTWKTAIPTIIGCETLKIFSNFKKSAVKIFLSMQLAEIIFRGSVKNAGSFFLFNLFSQALKKINDTPEKKIKAQYHNFIYFFIIKLLKDAGAAPEVKICLSCGAKNNLSYFSILRGGSLCLQCAKNDKNVLKIKNDILKIINDLKNERWNFVANLRLSNYQNFILSKIIYGFFEMHFNQKLLSPYLIPSIR